MKCPNCKDKPNLFTVEHEFVLLSKGPHIELACNRCGRYIKFVNEEEYLRLRDRENILDKVNENLFNQEG